MTIVEAIENRIAYLKNGQIPKSTEDYNATLLSIEALEEVARARRLGPPLKEWRLQGETEEGG